MSYAVISKKGLPCHIKPILCQEGYCQDCAIYHNYQAHQTTMGRTANLQPEWLREYEREQMSLVQLLKLQVTQKRKEALAEAICGNREHKLVFATMVNAYDVVLRLIDKALGGKG